MCMYSSVAVRHLWMSNALTHRLFETQVLDHKGLETSTTVSGTNLGLVP